MLFELQELLGDDWPDDWEISSYGDTLICPCGHEIEEDGECPNGHVSIVRQMGLI